MSLPFSSNCPTASNEGDSELSAGGIVAIVITLLVVLALLTVVIAILVLLFIQRRNKYTGNQGISKNKESGDN